MIKKFRVWDGKKFHYSELIIPRNINGKGPNEYLLYENYIYQQYTGLKDSENREIYEGDICSVQNEYKGQEVGKVIYGVYSDREYVEELQCWIFEAKYQKAPLSCVCLDWGVRHSRGLYTIKNTIKIIGNIFQTPELLENLQN